MLSSPVISVILLLTNPLTSALVINRAQSALIRQSSTAREICTPRTKVSKGLSAHMLMYSDNKFDTLPPPLVYGEENEVKPISRRTTNAADKLSRMQKDDVTELGTLKVASVGVGTISWSSDSWTSIQNDRLQSVVSAACDSPSAFFDTAERYGSHLKTALGLGWGETETLMQKLLAERGDNSQRLTDYQRDNSKPVVATKFTPSPWRTNAASVVEACENSCERLGVDTIDLYQLHMPDIVQPLRFMGKESRKDEAYWDGLAECYNRGLVKNVGVCNYGPTLMMECQEALAKRGVPLASNQIAYSLIGRGSGSQETLDICNDIGVKVLACYPFAMGLLTGKYSASCFDNKLSANEGTDFNESLLSNQKTALEVSDLEKYAYGDGETIPFGGITPLLRALEEVAEKRRKTVAQVALNYIVCKGAIPIPGANTESQVVDNMGAQGWRLNSEEISTLESAADGLGFGFEGAGFKRTSEKFVGYGVEKWRLD